ncbi:MAG: glycoside hydrolase family 28 protein [Bryobacterales bacterium]|nr:glycoside hydrolase family 28 protein [Bryobacterales bacterium]
MNRRDLLQLTPAGLSLGAAQPGPAGAGIFDVKNFGAATDGLTLAHRAINAAIDACHQAGGGVVYLAPGVYLSGTVVLKSNVTLYLEAGATLLGSKNLGDYDRQPGPPEKGDANQKHLVFARDAENVGLAGPGRIDGQGPAFWVPSGRAVPPPEDAWRDVATYDWKPLDRASPLVEFAGCRNLRIEDLRIENASGWTLRPVNCDNVLIRGIAIKNPVIGPNTDGIDPTGCRNVFISDCFIDTGDDAICLKSENPYGGEVRVTRNVTITNCVLTCCCNGLKFGTATRGGFENVTFTNSVIFNERVDPRARVISGIALEMVDGGWIEGVVISNIRMQNVRTPIFIRRGNRRPRPDGTPGTLRGVMIENVHATGAILTNSITGLPGFDVEDVTLSHLRIDSEEAGKEEWAARLVPEQERSYPEARMFGRLPSYGLYCRHVKDLRLRGIEFGAAAGEARPAIVCDDVKSLDIDGLRAAPVSSGQPVVKLIQTRRAFLRGCVAPSGTKTFLEVQGDATERIAVAASDLSAAAKAVETGAGVPPGAIATS